MAVDLLAASRRVCRAFSVVEGLVASLPPEGFRELEQAMAALGEAANGTEASAGEGVQVEL